MEKGSSPLDTLRQLRELLDAGTITPQEFETLKARLLADQLAAPAVPPSAPPTVPLNPTFVAPATTSSSTEPVRPEPIPTPPVASAPTSSSVEELPPMLDFFKQPQTSGSLPPPPPVAPVREEKPSPYVAPTTPPPLAPAAPEFLSPRPTTPPPSPTPRESPQFYPPASSTPPPTPAAATPDFFLPRTQTTVPVEPIRSAVPPVPPPPVDSQPRQRATEPLEEDDEAEEPAKSPLGKILAIGGALLLLGLIWYLVMGQSRSSEHLTSISQTAADTVSVAPETGPQAEQLDLPPAVAPETVRVAPVVPPTATTDSVATGATAGNGTNETQSASASAAPETAPAESVSEATDRVRDVLAAYYADIQAPPFSADQYFAPQVELFVILRNTTPAAIGAWLEQNRFAELKDAQFQVEPGSLRVSSPANDGSRVATYIERGRGFRQSLQKNQYIRAQMRLRLNPDYKIVYQKQERLLENTLSEPPTATTPSTTPTTE